MEGWRCVYGDTGEKRGLPEEDSLVQEIEGSAVVRLRSVGA